ncbi:MAG: shikimate dehydrogenase, partial [Deltaproteobacteria bacterium]|nr:shikimate dehydrogenase [Deltaproteobacteria bacterium]
MDIYGIFGYPIAHSRSPQMHNRTFQKLGIDAVYVPFL